jgi:ribosomal protein L11 methyltransferase
MKRRVEDGWFRIDVNLPAYASDAVSELLFRLGSCGLEVQSGAEGGKTGLKAYFRTEKHRARVVSGLWNGLMSTFGDLRSVRVQVAEVPLEDWASSWKSRFRPVYPVPAVAVCPPWERVDDPEGGFTLVIEPKTAFGTGHHETTRLALKMMHAVVKPGDTVLDVGTGSGILSLAAAGFGAARVTGIDIDPTAVQNARANTGLNEMAGDVVFRVGTVEGVTGDFDVVVANIDSRTLRPLLPSLASRVAARGNLILGGVQVRERATFLKALRTAGLRVVEVLDENEWLGIRAA